MDRLKPCPFCNGKARISIREIKYYGQNELGCKKIKFGSQGICNRCHARGGIATAIIITDRVDSRLEFNKLKIQAIDAWNGRRCEHG